MASRQAFSFAVFALLVVLGSGCLSGVPSVEQTPSTTTVQPPHETTSNAASATLSEMGCAKGVAFWGLGDSARSHTWAPNVVRIGYTLPANTSTFLVVYENDTVLGTSHVTNANPDYAVAADGDRITLTTRLEGTHTLRVVSVADANGNGQYDPTGDTPCRENGTVIQAGPQPVNFSVFNTTTPSR